MASRNCSPGFDPPGFGPLWVSASPSSAPVADHRYHHNRRRRHGRHESSPSSSSSSSSSSVAILAQGPRWTSYLHRCLEPRWTLTCPISYLLVHFCTKRSLSFMSQSWCCTGCGNLELGESPYVSLLRADSERIQWEFVGASRQERQDKWKGKRCAHQATGQATIQWCPGGEQPRHLFQWRETSERETAACTDCSCVQSTGRVGALWRQRADATWPS